MLQDLKKNLWVDPGSNGLPEDYPCPPHHDDLLFYIQRNQNKNTVIYEVNRRRNSEINTDFPMHAYWIRYTDGGEIVELNHYQNQLAYGYESEMIDLHTFQFNFVSYKQMNFYIARFPDRRYRALCRINGKMSILHHIYVYAEELGVFPNVKFIELFGKEMDGDLFCYQKINVEYEQEIRFQ